VNVPPMRFPELRTPRFLLRRIAPADAEAVFLGLSDPKVIQHYGVSYQTPEEAQFQMRWFEDLLAQGTGIWWAICEPSVAALRRAAPSISGVIAPCADEPAPRQLHIPVGFPMIPPAKRFGQACAAGCARAARFPLDIE